MENFFSFGLHKQLLESLKQLDFNQPTPIQSQAIPPALEGKDILGSAQTGTGKTAAFGIPLVSKLLLNQGSSALVIVPTRELAIQVIAMIEKLLGSSKATIKSVLLIGGEPIFKQLRQLKKRPRVIVGTPGRINDHLIRGTLALNHADFLVLDEADRMLDMGFLPQIDKIIELMPKKRQTLLFSATLPKNVVKMSQKYLYQPVRVDLGVATLPLTKLKQELVHVNESEKYHQLSVALQKETGSVIIFVKTKLGTERIAKRLREDGHKASAIHGDLRHHKREKAMNGFRNNKYRIMVATDIASRGIDVSHVKQVINYDLPQCPEDYIHRIGRTARAGATGSALCLISPSDRGKWRAINRLLNPDSKPKSTISRRNKKQGNPYPRQNKPKQYRSQQSKAYGNRKQKFRLLDDAS